MKNRAIFIMVRKVRTPQGRVVPNRNCLPEADKESVTENRLPLEIAVIVISKSKGEKVR